MNDEGLGQPPDHEPVDDDWQGGLRRWARGVNAAYGRHPWLLDIPIDGVPITPNNLAWLDWGLRLLAPAQLSATDAISAVLMISGLTRWQAVIDRSTADDELGEAEQFVFGELVTADRYPALSSALAAGGLSDDESDSPFVFALERALDGLQSSVGSAGQVPAPVEPTEVRVDDVEVPRDARLKEATRIRREAEAKVREAENKLRDARHKESELVTKARQRAEAAQTRG